MRRVSKVERQCSVTEYNDIHVEGLKVGWAVWVLVERAETDEVVIAEKLNLFASLFHQNILGRQRMDAKCTAERLHLLVRGAQHIEPPGFHLVSRPITIRCNKVTVRRKLPSRCFTLPARFLTDNQLLKRLPRSRELREIARMHRVRQAIRVECEAVRLVLCKSDRCCICTALIVAAVATHTSTSKQWAQRGLILWQRMVRVPLASSRFERRRVRSATLKHGELALEFVAADVCIGQVAGTTAVKSRLCISRAAKRCAGVAGTRTKTRRECRPCTTRPYPLTFLFRK